jgi:hypothetical protein
MWPFSSENWGFRPFFKPPFYPPKKAILPPLKLKFNGPGAIWKITPRSWSGEFLLTSKINVSRDSTPVLHRDNLGYPLYSLLSMWYVYMEGEGPKIVICSKTQFFFSREIYVSLGLASESL